MGIVRYGRRAIRRIERETGERIVHAAGPWATTIDHRHLEWTGAGWQMLEWPVYDDCGLALGSCWSLFGADEYGRRVHFMLGRCSRCSAESGQPHAARCPTLLDLLGWRSINPDYWPVPVHRPLWLDRATAS